MRQARQGLLAHGKSWRAWQDFPHLGALGCNGQEWLQAAGVQARHGVCIAVLQRVLLQLLDAQLACAHALAQLCSCWGRIPLPDAAPQALRTACLPRSPHTHAPSPALACAGRTREGLWPGSRVAHVLVRQEHHTHAAPPAGAAWLPQGRQVHAKGLLLGAAAAGRCLAAALAHVEPRAVDQAGQLHCSDAQLAQAVVTCPAAVLCRPHSWSAAALAIDSDVGKLQQQIQLAAISANASLSSAARCCAGQHW